MHTLNLGIVAHVDAGKTSLTERLLHTAGVIDEIGSVDDGSTQTDSLALERRRGITIKSAVVSFVVDEVTVNLIDTPGHPDFIAEVERVLSVLDGAVLVISAVEGVQAQTRVLMRTLRRLRIPTLVFVNKTDRRGADPERVTREIAAKLTPAAIRHDMPSAEVLAENSDTFLAAYLGDEVSEHLLHKEFETQAKRALVHPVFFGSAITGAGVTELITGIKRMLPGSESDVDGPVSGTVFKVERGPAGEKIAYVRMFSGTLRTRDRLPADQKVTAISVFENGSAVRSASVSAGQIGKLWGLTEVRIGDAIGEPRAGTGQHHFAPPTLETVVAGVRPSDKAALHPALTRLAEQDPLIDLRQDEIRQEISVSLYGEVQKEVIQATLADEFGVEVTFRETTTICVERPRGSGAAFEIIDKEPNPFLATVGLRVDPAPIGSGVDFRLEVELGSMPYSFVKAVEETTKETLRQGLHGWRVTDCVVTMTHSGYWARQSHSHGTFDKTMSSTAGDFRNLTPLVLMNALREAGTTVYEPMHRFRLELPPDTFGVVSSALAKLRAIPLTLGASAVLEGEIPAAKVHELQQRLPSLTRGEGVLESAFERYQPVTGEVPERPRTDHNPLNRKEYLLQVLRRVGV
ncbi:ribosomal protection tetracycline resistance protein [Amycolatopsis xylanica]|uniref:Ribosomal protection tetracycline resistance protein n=1 Tax=Amycolatopsis xylanica TaxID=589385 RepID=A0A1H2ZMT3_9PSEU|nr:TetM/TetW/TetO/TetS family tetracycline resistance ribosomal protection protein [Amycolatopsis xylanica]SDX18717.1 ribosomal protection tetracycline resistance protein [Amycolatopsis xylanica]